FVTSKPTITTTILQTSRKPRAGHLEACHRWPEVPISCANVPGWRETRAPPQHLLIQHKLAVVLTDGSRRGFIARVRAIGATGPFPNVTVQMTWYNGPAIRPTAGYRRWHQTSRLDPISVMRRLLGRVQGLRLSHLPLFFRRPSGAD